LILQNMENFSGTLLKQKKESPIDVRVTCGPQFSRIMTQVDPKTFLGKRKFQGCMAGGEFAFISYRGDVQTCGFLNISTGNMIDNRTTNSSYFSD